METFAIERVGEARVDSPYAGIHFVPAGRKVVLEAAVDSVEELAQAVLLEAAGPRRQIFFEPEKTRAAIVTCGGLCPGLNDVIRALTMVLWYRYGVRDILGLRYGFEGLVPALGHEPMRLSPERVEDIHQHGGTVLGSSRGPQDVAAMVDFLAQEEIKILFVIGGDGTQRGALAITREVSARGVPIAVVGVPKTIDNDIAFTNRTFGFETAVAMTRMPIDSAHVEAKGVCNGVGLVKLMGRESGFVAAYAALASSDVNLVLVPEVPFTVKGVLTFLEKRLRNKAHAVVVVAEGAGQDLVDASGTDASGNRALGDIGVFLKHAIANHFSGTDMPAAVKYIDPSYTIRSSRANADDTVFCFQLAEHAVHAGMSGRTGLVICSLNGHFVHIPAQQAVSHRKKIDASGPLWQSVLDNTGQPAVLV